MPGVILQKPASGLDVVTRLTIFFRIKYASKADKSKEKNCRIIFLKILNIPTRKTSIKKIYALNTGAGYFEVFNLRVRPNCGHMAEINICSTSTRPSRSRKQNPKHNKYSFSKYIAFGCGCGGGLSRSKYPAVVA